MRLTVPVFLVERVLLPGATMVLHRTTPDPEIAPPSGQVVVLLRSSHDPAGHHAIGTLADVIGARRTDDGRVLVSLAGRERVEVLGAHQDGSTADVVVGEAAGDDAARRVRAEAVSALRRYLGALAETGTVVDILTEISPDPVAASYQVASHARVSALELQFLLEAETAEERLDRVQRMLAREAELLRRTIGRGG